MPPNGTAFMYIETSGNNSANDNMFVSWERTDIIQITNIKYYYNRYSINLESHKNLGRFRIQFLLEDNTWLVVYTIAKKTQYSDNSTDWTLLNLDFTQQNNGINLIYDQIDTVYADMCFNNITKTRSIY